MKLVGGALATASGVRLLGGPAALAAPPVRPLGQDGAAALRGLYAGTAAWVAPELVQVGGRAQGHRVVQQPVQLGIGRPTGSASAGFETNPFHLSLGTATADLTLTSASMFDVPSWLGGGSRITLQFWELELIGEEFAGTLTDTHASESAVFNFINIDAEIAPNSPSLVMPYPAPMLEDTTIEGRLTGDRLQVYIAGALGSLHGPIPFEALIEAARRR
jgi:hypothetical protein